MADPSPLESPDTSGIEISRANLIAQQQRLMSLLDERSKPNPLEFWSTLAGAAANSGNYGTQTLASLGAGAGLANRQQQEKELTGAQMRMEIANSQDQMAREQGMYKALQNVMGGSDVSAGVANTLGINRDQRSVLSGLSPRDRQILLSRASTGRMEDIREVQKTLSGMVAENAKVPDAVKTMNNYVSMLPTDAQASARRVAAQINLLGNPKDYVEAFIRIGEAINGGKADVGMLQEFSSTLAGLASGKVGANPPAPDVRQPVATPAPQAMVPPTGESAIAAQRELDRLRILQDELIAKPNDPDLPKLIEEQKKKIASMLPSAQGRTPLPLTMQREVEQDRIKKQQDADIARQAEMEKSWSTGAETANRDRQNAELTYKLVERNPSGFGLLSKPGWDKALASLAETGVRIGPYNVSIADIQGAMLKAGSYTQQDIDTVTKVQQLAIQTQLALASQAKGSVSNYEDRLFQAAGISISDSPKVIQYKTQLVIARSEAVQKIWSEWQKFKKTGGNIDDFRASDKYKSIQDQYEKNLDATFKAYK